MTETPLHLTIDDRRSVCGAPGPLTREVDRVTCPACDTYALEATMSMGGAPR